MALRSPREASENPSPGELLVEQWFASMGWSPFDFQRKVWQAYRDGNSGLIHSATGTGKTYAIWMAPIIDWVNHSGDHGGLAPQGLKVLWITPLRALAGDTAETLALAIRELGLPWSVGIRTGDSAGRRRTLADLPNALVTTPESLSIMMSRDDFSESFSALDLVVVDEWHELLSSKRGVQTELGLARLRALRADLRTWGISATLGNLTEAREALIGTRVVDASPAPLLVQGVREKETVIDSVLPDVIERFPWAGHLGAQMIPLAIESIAEGGTSLIFCNTRSQAEIWYQAILEARPDWKNEIALHHGSLDKEVREEAERGLKQGTLRAVVCTSSLDLGVDFSPVDRVLQIGSPKGVARLLQRAGRSGHRPGIASRVTCIPTHALELVDISAARVAARSGAIESRVGLSRPLDLLVQHMVTLACGEGFAATELLAEVRSTMSFRDLSDEEWSWALDFVVRGGTSLQAYPEYRRVVLRNGRYLVEDKDIVRRHRMSIGTIVSDAAIQVQYVMGGRLGTVEESFIARLKPGDRFLFAGRPLEFVRMKDTTAMVRKAHSIRGAIPRWEGGRLPLSSELSRAIRDELDAAKHGVLGSPEMRLLAPILELQAKWSAIPGADELLIERVETKDGHHLFIYPFEGRLVHQGLAALFAYRIAKLCPLTFSMAMNDYGFELLAASEAPLEEAIDAGLFSSDRLGEDIFESLNSVEMAKRQFREIARVAGLVFQGYPGAGKSARQLQASSGLFFDVFSRYEPSNLLLRQAEREVLEQQLERSRIAATLERLQHVRVRITNPPRPTPISFPILIDRLRETLSSESLSDRILRLTRSFEKLADSSDSTFPSIE